MQALGSMQLGSSAFQGKQLQLRPVQVAQPFRPAVVPVRAAKTLSGKVVSTDMQKTAVRPCWDSVQHHLWRCLPVLESWI